MSDIIAMLEEIRNADGHIYIQDLPEGFTLVVEGNWSQEHKQQYAEHIVMHSPSGRHFSLEQARSGSYHSDWYYEETYVDEVQKVTETVVVTKWVPV